jgi:hypothetical protein
MRACATRPIPQPDRSLPPQGQGVDTGRCIGERFSKSPQPIRIALVTLQSAAKPRLRCAVTLTLLESDRHNR